jgi:hypothetical protein
MDSTSAGIHAHFFLFISIAHFLSGPFLLSPEYLHLPTPSLSNYISCQSLPKHTNFFFSTLLSYPLCPQTKSSTIEIIFNSGKE